MRKATCEARLSLALCAVLCVCVAYQCVSYVGLGAPAPALPHNLLRLNHDVLECPRILVLRTPKTASSSLADLLHQRLDAVSAQCKATYLSFDKVLPHGQYTLTANNLEDVNLSPYTAYCAHMNYTPELRQLIGTSRLYRVATLRGAEARAESLLAYEEKRINLVPVRPMLEYLGAPRLYPAVSDSDRMSESLSQAKIGKQIEAAVKHFNLIVVAEYWEMSLAVLMHDLRWRLVDLLLPPVNVQQSAAKKAAVKRVLLRWGSERYYKWMIDVDTQLYAEAVKKLRARFASLPPEYQRIPDALRVLQPRLAKACPTIKGRKHFRTTEIKCFRRFRKMLLNQAGVDGRVGDIR